MSDDVDERGHCSKCGGTHYGTGLTCVFDQTFTPTPPWPKLKSESTDAMMHASAPPGHKCADCSIDNGPCPDCKIAGLTRERDAERARYVMADAGWREMNRQNEAIKADLAACVAALEKLLESSNSISDTALARAALARPGVQAVKP